MTMGTPSRLLLWTRIPAGSPFWDDYPDDTAAGPNTPHFEAIIGVLSEGVAVGNLVWFGSPSSAYTNLLVVLFLASLTCFIGRSRRICDSPIL